MQGTVQTCANDVVLNCVLGIVEATHFLTWLKSPVRAWAVTLLASLAVDCCQKDDNHVALPMGKGVEYATADAVEALKAELRDIAKAADSRDKANQSSLKKMEHGLGRQVQELLAEGQEQKNKMQVQENELQKLHEQQAQMQQSLKDQVEGLQKLVTESDRLQKSVSGIEELAKQNYQALQDMQKQQREEQMEELKKGREDLQKHTLEAARKDATDAKDEAKKELEGAKKTVRGEMNEGLEKLQKSLMESMKQTFDELEKNMKDTRDALEAECKAVLEETKQKQEALEKSLQEKLQKVEDETREKTEQLEASERKNRETLAENLNTELKKLDGELKESCQDLKQVQLQDAEDLQSARREAEARSAAVLAESRADIQLLQGETTRLNGFCAGVSGLSTRQVEWCLQEDTLKQLERLQDHGQVDDPALAGDAQTGFFSPAFEAAGASGLQLELRAHTRKSGPGEGGDEEETTGNQCSLYLWAPAGLQLVFRLFLGTESVILRHSFDGKTPCGLKRMGSIIEQKSVDGTLRLGMEIHESLVESTADAGGGCNPMAGGEDPRGPMDGTLSVQRYLNHRLYELMQSQGRVVLDQLHKKVDVMRSRAIRRVQWRLENGPLLFQTFAKEQAVRSTAFQAAGIGGMQLVFYPKGCAGARQGFCSFFLSCPPGCTLRCWLWAGRWRREARPSEQPEMVGRVNFARFENVIDPVDESVELVLEIEEAHQTRKATTSSQPLPLEGSCDPSNSVEATKDVSWIERCDTSTTKIQHSHKAQNPQRETSGPSGPSGPADGVQQLLSIWTTQGFHSFSDLEDGSNMRASTASTAKEQSPPTPRPPQQGRAKRKGNAPNVRVASAREGKYKEYSQGSHPLPSY